MNLSVLPPKSKLQRNTVVLYISSAKKDDLTYKVRSSFLALDHNHGSHDTEQPFLFLLTWSQNSLYAK